VSIVSPWPRKILAGAIRNQSTPNLAQRLGGLGSPRHSILGPIRSIFRNLGPRWSVRVWGAPWDVSGGQGRVAGVHVAWPSRDAGHLARGCEEGDLGVHASLSLSLSGDPFCFGAWPSQQRMMARARAKRVLLQGGGQRGRQRNQLAVVRDVARCAHWPVYGASARPSVGLSSVGLCGAQPHTHWCVGRTSRSCTRHRSGANRWSDVIRS
jgi:hypothetical protein